MLSLVVTHFVLSVPTVCLGWDLGLNCQFLRILLLTLSKQGYNMFFLFISTYLVQSVQKVVVLYIYLVKTDSLNEMHNHFLTTLCKFLCDLRILCKLDIIVGLIFHDNCVKVNVVTHFELRDIDIGLLRQGLC